MIIPLFAFRSSYHRVFILPLFRSDHHTIAFSFFLFFVLLIRKLPPCKEPGCHFLCYLQSSYSLIILHHSTSLQSPFPVLSHATSYTLNVVDIEQCIAKFRIPAKYLSPLASSLTSISYNNLVSFSTQGQKLTVYSFQVCCHFCHSFFAFNLLIVKLLSEMLKVTATKIKTILGFLQ